MYSFRGSRSSMLSGGGFFGATPQNSLEVAAAAEAANDEHVTAKQTWAHSGGMQRPGSPKVLQLPMFCEVEALKVLVLYCSGGLGSKK